MILHKNCPYCKKRVEIVSEVKLSTSTVLNFKCGHTVVEEQIAAQIDSDGISDFTALDGSTLFPFQVEGIKFAFDSNVQCLISDEMRLGKTVQSFSTMALKKDKLLPAIFICKAAARVDILQQCLNWMKVIPQIIDGSKVTCHEKFKVHIVSHDSVSRLEENESWKRIVARAKTVVVDECHLIKNHTSKRTKAVMKVCRPPADLLGEDRKDQVVTEKYHILLSATPIENNATEYFPALNILHPERFFNREAFLRTYVDTYFDLRTGAWKYGGLLNPKFFKEVTKDFVIRRTLDEVMPQVPKVWKQNKFTELSEDAQAVYDKEWQEFCDFWDANEDSKDFAFYGKVAARIMRLRHLVGIAKVDYTMDLIAEHLGSTNRKLTVFVHHKEVGKMMVSKLNEALKELELPEVLQLGSADTADAQNIIDRFRNSDSRVLIASTLVAGASVDLQFCSDVIMHERQWNFTKESQAAVGRFRGLLQKESQINLTYPIALGTVDEYSAEVVDRKEKIFVEAMSGKKVSEDQWNENSVMREIGEVLRQKGRERWSIKQ